MVIMIKCFKVITLKKINVLDVPINNITMSQAVEFAEDVLQKDAKNTLVFTPNPEIVYIAHKDSGFREVLKEADLLLPDGIGVVKASEKLGTPLTSRVAGYDFLLELLKIADKHHLRVFLLGGKPSVADRAAKSISAQYSGINICGTQDGYFDDTNNHEVIQKINEAAPDILVVCLGAPKQETWLVKNSDALQFRLAIGAGGAIDVISGDVRRAPKFIQRIHLEWLYRALCDPKRIPRLLVLPKFKRAVKKQAKKNN